MKRHSRTHIRHQYERHAKRGAFLMELLGWIDREDLKAREFLFDGRKAPRIVRSCRIYEIGGGTYIFSAYKGTDLEYALSKNPKLGKPIYGWCEERANHYKPNWKAWASLDKYANHTNRQRAKRAVYKMFLDPEYHDEYKPFYKW